MSALRSDPWLNASTLALPPPSVARYTVGLNVFGFFAVALLSGSLADRLRSAGAQLEEASGEIADLQALNQHVIDSLPSGLATADPGLRILTFNRGAEAITGLAFRAAVGRQIDDVLQLPAPVMESIQADLRVKRSRRHEFRYRTSDGRGDLEVGLTATHLETPRGRVGLLFTFQDVTSIKKLERDSAIQQRLAAVGEMAAGIAHEIRNPLASMSGSIQILRQELPLSPEQEQLMDIVLRESERLNTTIRSFLAYARPQRFQIERFDARRPLNDAALLLRNSIEVLEGHEIVVQVPDTELWYEADEGQIKQIVWNLASNGLRAMPDGGRLYLIGAREPSGGVVLTVRDEGIGIPPEELDGLFQPFHGTFAQGSGLGLAIVHRIVTDYNGEISVSSTAGLRHLGRRAPAGAHGGDLVSTALQPAVPATDRRPPRILVVDDERSMRELLAIVLRREGYEVLLAENGRAAIDLLEREPVDLLISDIKMPDLSGVDVLRAAKKIDQDILGIMITAFASTETAVEAMRLGACDYLSKPFDIDLLKMKVREKIENRQLKQENVLLKRTLGLSHQFSNIIGRSEAMLEVFKMIETVARTNSTILLTGESGTGKGLVAQAIHFHSLRRDKPMVSLNCGAMPENLLESELFGHMRGSFTGADTNKKGLLEVAERGTVFLDEIGEMSAVMQVKLLRVLQERRFRRVGGLEELQADIRVIAATNQDLARAISEGRFREDLYLPHQRHSDRAAAAPRAARGHSAHRGAFPGEVHRADGEGDHRDRARGDGTARAARLARQYPRAGERDGARDCARGERRDPAGKPARRHPRRGAARRRRAGRGLPESGFDLEAHVKEIEMSYIAEALKRAGGVQVKAAELLGMSFRSFRYYVKKYNLR